MRAVVCTAPIGLSLLHGLLGTLALATNLSFDQQGDQETRHVSRLDEKGYVLSSEPGNTNGLCIPGLAAIGNPDPSGYAIWVDDAHTPTYLNRSDDKPFDLDTMDVLVGGEGSATLEFRFIYPDGGTAVDWIEVPAGTPLLTVGLHRRQVLKANWRQVQGAAQGLGFDNLQVHDRAMIQMAWQP